MNSDEKSFLSVGAFISGVLALILGFAAVIFVRNNDGSAASGPVAEVINVTLTEFKISPATINIPPGSPAELHITNSGTMVHNFEIAELGASTGDIAPGSMATLRIKARDSGMLHVVCTISGHGQSGMTGMIMFGGTPGAGQNGGMMNGGMMNGDGSGPTGGMTPDEMDAAMEARAKLFPAKTAGHGGDPLEPKILADGTKEFDLTASVVDWEVEPGKIVKAWTYNGVVPGPAIDVDVGDKVRIVLTNQLPESTALHLHGIRVPNALDGVPPYTQDPIKPGTSFTYEFTAEQAGVGMYHSHHNAQVQVPNGLAGAFIVGTQAIPDALVDQGFTKIDQTVNMVLDDGGTIGLALNGKSFPATEPYTMKVGDVMLVNYFNEGLQTHPMHLHQPTGWIIAKDGVPLLTPTPSDTVLIGPGERYTVLYKALDPGVWAWHCHILNHAEGPQGMFGMVTAVIVSE